MTKIGSNMILVTSAFRGAESFSLIPVSEDCPYVEMMFDPTSGILAVISKVKKMTMHMLPRLSDDGQPVKLKSINNETGKVYKEQRVQMETFTEYYVKEKSEIESLIQMFAVNASSFDYSKYFVDLNAPKSPIILTK